MKPRVDVASSLVLLLLPLIGGVGAAVAQAPKSVNQPEQSAAYVNADGAFTHQGMLKYAGTPYTGNCDFGFSMYDAATAGTNVGGTFSQTNIAVSNGLFTAQVLYQNWGPQVWMEVSVRCPAGSGAYTVLSPREKITAAPYANTLRPGAQVASLDASGTTLTGAMVATSNNGLAALAYAAGSTAVYGYGGPASGWAGYFEGYGDGGVHTEGNGSGINHAALVAVNTNTGAVTPAGIAVYALNSSADATIVARNTGTGDAFRVINPAGNQIIYSVSNGGAVATAGTIAFNTLGAAGSTTLCRNASNQIATCSSSVRYKNNVANLGSGLDTIAQLRPVTFDWNATGERDLGFVAEEVDQVAPLLATRNANGLIEGVKYDRIGAVLVKAMQEQQDLIAALQARNANLDRQNVALSRQYAALEARTAALEQRALAVAGARGYAPASRLADARWAANALALHREGGTECGGPSADSLKEK